MKRASESEDETEPKEAKRNFDEKVYMSIDCSKCTHLAYVQFSKDANASGIHMMLVPFDSDKETPLEAALARAVIMAASDNATHSGIGKTFLEMAGYARLGRSLGDVAEALYAAGLPDAHFSFMIIELQK